MVLAALLTGWAAGDDDADALRRAREQARARLSEVTHCHRLGYRPDGRVDPVTEVDCLPTAPITRRPAPSLPSGTDERLRRSLPTGPAATEQSVEAAVDRLRLDPRVRRDVATADGTVGLALREGRRGSCLLARVVGDRVEVWRPPSVLMQPGELTCDVAPRPSAWGRRIRVDRALCTAARSPQPGAGGPRLTG
ncbi:hypothetical protein [Micromonospora halophytica]|uniref:Uncharacterized protein n=1 Tax=Micromonospora halophytica TaxID=47864 RepID=A0A1C5JEJ7_9ACTN|nr:hypothetical protein [Micromonospora halophytica]SCG68997.1 hypothetical protein GA0070560_12930 [Micromonospora halophytica]